MCAQTLTLKSWRVSLDLASVSWFLWLFRITILGWPSRKLAKKILFLSHPCLHPQLVWRMGMGELPGSRARKRGHDSTAVVPCWAQHPMQTLFLVGALELTRKTGGQAGTRYRKEFQNLAQSCFSCGLQGASVQVPNSTKEESNDGQVPLSCPCSLPILANVLHWPRDSSCASPPPPPPWIEGWHLWQFRTLFSKSGLTSDLHEYGSAIHIRFWGLVWTMCLRCKYHYHPIIPSETVWSFLDGAK